MTTTRDLHQRAVPILEAFYGPEHPEVGRALGNLAITLDRLGDTNAAARVRRRAAGILHQPRNVSTVDSEADAYDLWEEVCIQASHLERLEVVTAEEETRLLAQFRDAFLRDGATVPWWESLSLPKRVVPYGERHQALNDALRPMLAASAYLFATTDSGTLYGTVHGTVSNLLQLVAASSPFAFALTDADMTWVVFDTPPNELFVAGAWETAARPSPRRHES